MSEPAVNTIAWRRHVCRTYGNEHQRLIQRLNLLLIVLHAQLWNHTWDGCHATPPESSGRASWRQCQRLLDRISKVQSKISDEAIKLEASMTLSF